MEVMRRAGGALTVHSDGSGTRFGLLLPEVDPMETAEAVPEEATSDGNGGQLIVVVDDNDLVRAALVESLKAEGDRVVDVASAEEALGQLQAMGAQIDAVLTDLTMPGMDGGELVEVIQQHWPHVRCIVMSGYQAATESHRVPVTLYKPFNTDELKRALSGK